MLSNLDDSSSSIMSRRTRAVQQQSNMVLSCLVTTWWWWLFLIMVGTTQAQQQQQACSVCGDGLAVGAPDAIFMLFSFVGEPDKTCGELQEQGDAGLISPDDCSLMPLLIHETCQCIDAKCAACGRHSEGCAICGPGMEVGNSDGLIEAPPYSPATCYDLELFAEVGFVDQDACQQYSQFLDVCECQPIIITEEADDLCAICPDGLEIGAADALVPLMFPHAGKNCSWLNDAAKEGSISRWDCRMLQTLSIQDACQCVVVVVPDAPDASTKSSSSSRPLNTAAIWIPLVVIFSVIAGLVVAYLRVRRKRNRQLLQVEPDDEHVVALEDMDPPDNEEELRKRVLMTLFPNKADATTSSSGRSRFADMKLPDIRFLRRTNREIGCICSICLDDLDTKDGVAGLCDHSYHRECIMTWLVERNNDDCPLCRQKMWDPDEYQLIADSLRPRPVVHPDGDHPIGIEC